MATCIVAVACERFPNGARVEIHDHLIAPVAVTGVEPAALVLADGRRIALEGVGDLVAACPAIRAGVDVSPDGTTWGLIPVFHWCGNDRVRAHEERIPLPLLARYFREVDDARPLSAAFDKRGWFMVDHFHPFAEWASVSDPYAAEVRFPGE